MLIKDDFIAQYRVIKQIAQTQGCYVYLVHCDALNKHLVVKLNAAGYADNMSPIAQQADTFVEQAKLMHQFSGHKHIVNLMHMGVYEDEFHRFSKQDDSGNVQKHHFMVMPFYPQTLADWLALQQQKLSPKAAIVCIEHVLLALTSLHKQGVLHLDIKPQNIFLDDAHAYYLGDFDNAKVIPDSPLTASALLTVTSNLGAQSRLTPQYASPEQFTNNSPLNAQSDLYSVGALAYRILTGESLPTDCSDLSATVKQALYANHSPTWLTDLIVALTQVKSSLRPSSAQACLAIIQTNQQQAEDEATIVVNANDMYSSNTRQLRDKIEVCLLNRGDVSASDIDLWAGLYLQGVDTQATDTQAAGPQEREMQGSNAQGAGTQAIHSNSTAQSNTEKIAVVNLLVDEVKQQLIDDKSLGNWFTWVNYIRAKRREQGSRIAPHEYDEILQVGMAGRADNPDAAIQLMSSMFSSTSLTLSKMMRFVIPCVLIVSVFFYWAVNNNAQYFKQTDSSELFDKGLDGPLQQPFFDSEEHTPAEESVWAGNKNAAEPIDNLIADKVNRGEAAIHQQKTSIAQQAPAKDPVNSTAGLSELGPNTTPIDKRQVDKWRYQLKLNEQFAQGDATNAQSVIVEMVKISPDFAVMRNEVTRALYQMCIDEGSCRRVKKFTTANTTGQADLSNHPMVNISWYEVTQGFMPWLNQKTGINFSLPRIGQWQLYGKLPNNLSSLNQLSHCKNCKNRQSRDFVARVVNGVTIGTISVEQLPADKLGLIGVWGNAQEWLLDCNIQNQIERCDQAIVIGGSWIDNLSTLQRNSSSVLLKQAATPTTGFRLIEVLND